MLLEWLVITVHRKEQELLMNCIILFSFLCLDKLWEE